ncbi:MAG: twin-arginine translocase TatA/TatE family subunit [Cellvibrionales bacterium]|nr:twin-arginine translocase TatA/TatE family subunit [Cellvibrionales bacterium]
MGFGIKELVIILLIVLILFGSKRLKSLGTDLGSAIKGFKKSVADDADKTDEKAASESLETKVESK